MTELRLAGNIIFDHGGSVLPALYCLHGIDPEANREFERCHGVPHAATGLRATMSRASQTMWRIAAMCQSSDEEDDIIRGDVLKLDFGKNTFSITEKQRAAPPSQKKLPPQPGRNPNFTSIPGSRGMPEANEKADEGNGDH
jgi:hypothetical protein